MTDYAAQITALADKVTELERIVSLYHALTETTAILTVIPDGTSFRVAMAWPEAWQAAEWAVLTAMVMRHIVHNAGVDEDAYIDATLAALDQMDDQIGGGRVM